MSSNGTVTGDADGNAAHVASVLEKLREEVRSRRARLQLSDKDNPKARSLAELRSSADAVNEVWFVSAHLPINWRLRIVGRMGSYAKRALRILLRWYINPIVEQQNNFNSAVARAFSELVTYQERMAREWLLLEERISQLEIDSSGAGHPQAETVEMDAAEPGRGLRGNQLENLEAEQGSDAGDC